jgi:hypothetical protein
MDVADSLLLERDNLRSAIPAVKNQNKTGVIRRVPDYDF